ncbi:hypothetical protein H072_3870 [Dactylellina haptotyla CBS 200.50]|uniref:Aminoacyl-transfer RNA synthetases class-II family profile domain-containing protein n=1 Tax=Dactylellina haptotyla (strain CBS 200.50) TaxID=1284197 RepID=S8AGW1_DACHA|nr:hypothetical protein H072_3870 [Dactylellina haptotyla CBS 200.50]
MTVQFRSCVRCRLDLARAAGPLLSRHPIARTRRKPAGLSSQWQSIRTYIADDPMADDIADRRGISNKEYRAFRRELVLKAKERRHLLSRIRARVVWWKGRSKVQDPIRSYWEEFKQQRIGHAIGLPVKKFYQPWSLPAEPSNRKAIPELTKRDLGRTILIRAWLIKTTVISKYLVFCKLGHDGKKIQATVNDYTEFGDLEFLKSLKPHTPVEVEGVLAYKLGANPTYKPGPTPFHERVEILMQRVTPIGNPPADPIIEDTVYDADKRYLTLRTNQKSLETLQLRSTVSLLCRNHLVEEGFTEVETPLLFKSTPEGAREFLVPTRTPNMMYALPQSPQQYKQILMASGVLKYFQVAKCFRDEDLRADRQPEFTQLDLEMGFSSGSDVQRMVERLLKRIWYEILGVRLPAFPYLRYHDAIRLYGSDKPDLRYDMKINDITEVMEEFLPSPEQNIAHHPFKYELISVPDIIISNRQFKTVFGTMTDPGTVLSQYMKGPERSVSMSYFTADFKKEKFRENILFFAPYLDQHEGAVDNFISKLESLGYLKPNSIVILAKRKKEFNPGGGTPIGEARKALAANLVKEEIIPPLKGWKFCWVTRFPLFTKMDPADGEPGQSASSGYKATHHPFTAPMMHHLTKLYQKPWNVLGQHYDIVLNGVELGGGSTRIHNAALQKIILEEILGVPPSKMKTFNHLLEMLDSGCPPHAGLALGFDRLIATLAGTSSIRDVIAFPKNNNGADVMVGSPSLVKPSQLKPYGVEMINPPEITEDDVEEAEEEERRKEDKPFYDVPEEEEYDEVVEENASDVAPFHISPSSISVPRGLLNSLEEDSIKSSERTKAQNKWSDLLDIASKQFRQERAKAAAANASSGPRTGEAGTSEQEVKQPDNQTSESNQTTMSNEKGWKQISATRVSDLKKMLQETKERT